MKFQVLRFIGQGINHPTPVIKNCDKLSPLKLIYLKLTLVRFWVGNKLSFYIIVLIELKLLYLQFGKNISAAYMYKKELAHLYMFALWESDIDSDSIDSTHIPSNIVQHESFAIAKTTP